MSPRWSSDENVPLIEVVGSLNMDLVTVTERVPGPGETLMAQSFTRGFGGKGANQAVACARLSRQSKEDWQSLPEGGLLVEMVGAVGGDSFGEDFVTHLEFEGVGPAAVSKRAGESTGTAVIIVEQQTGENRILVTPGANATVTLEDLDMPHNSKAVTVFQLEIPLQTVLAGIKRAHHSARTVIFNPAPAVALPDSIYRYVDHLILNETEASMLSGIAEAELLASLDTAAEFFLTRGVKAVVLTLGSKGVFFRLMGSTKGKTVEALRVKAVDTTAAGDTFVGAYAVHVARNLPSIRAAPAAVSAPAAVPAAAAAAAQVTAPSGERNGEETVMKEGVNESVVEAAVAWANRAAAVSVQRAGAQSSIPFAGEV